MNIGKVYAFKEGIVMESNLILTEEDAFKKIELNRINKDLTEDSHKDYINNGFSIIKKVYDVSKEDGLILVSPKATGECIIAKDITLKDSTNILKVLKQFELDDSIKRTYIYNININEFGEKDYDCFDPYIQRRSTALEVAPYFLNEKTNNLSEFESIVIDKYRNFNLEELLISNYSELYKLNNRNTGVIVISPNDIYKSTCKKMRHSKEVEKLVNEFKTEINPNMDIATLTEKSSSIIIEVNYKELFIFIPEKLNNYQASQINDIILFIEKANKKIVDNIAVCVARCYDWDFECIINIKCEDDFETVQINLDLFKEKVDSMINHKKIKSMVL